MKYKSKVDIWLAVIVWGTLLFLMGTGYNAIIEGVSGPTEVATIVLINMVLPLMIIWIWLTTFYIVDEKNLYIHYGPFKRTIPLHSIKRIKKTFNPLSSPALSLKRLEIRYNQYNIALISPKNRDEFMSVLKERCPSAEIE